MKKLRAYLGRILIHSKNNIFLVAVILFFFAQSCTNKQIGEGKMIFHYNESAGISTLDPAFAKDQAIIWACNQLYCGLVQLDSNLNVKPCIAKSYNISEDRRTYTFTLRDDVYFHKDISMPKAERVTAKDFVYSFNRIVDPKVASPGTWIFEHIKKDNTGSYAFSAPNDTTFVVELKEPFAPFLGLLSMPYAYVVPRKAVEYYGQDFRKHPVGCGPFSFKFWKEGVKLVLVKNDNYFEKDSIGNRLPYLDAVNITFIVDKQSVFLEFIKGNIDFISGIDPNYKDEILTRKGTLQPKYQNKINLITQPYLNTEYFGFYLDDKSSILTNKLIRQAINYGFDRQKMIKYLRNNIGIAGNYGMVPPSLLENNYANNNHHYEYNPKKARKLLEQSGYYKNRPIIKLSTTSAYLDLCKYIQQQLILIGMNIKLDITPPAELREMMAQGKSVWFRGSWIADYPDAENYLSLFYSKNFAPSGPNYTHFSNKLYDKLYEQSIRETDLAKRQKLYSQMNDIIIDEAPVVVLYYDRVLRFTQKNIHGLNSNAMNLLTLKTVYKQ